LRISGAARSLSWLLLALSALATAASAATADLGKAQQLMNERRYQEAYDLLRSLDKAASDAATNLLLGEAALRTQRYAEALVYFRQAQQLGPDSVDAHLGIGRTYVAQGDYGRALIEFETVLRFDDLPADLRERAEIYARAAESYAGGSRLLPFGYVMVGGGNYRVNATIGSDAFGGAGQSDNFFSARIGGGVNYLFAGDWAFDASLDYRYRNYEGERRDDRDLRWNAAFSRTIGDGNIIGGVRGRNSYRGDGIYRDDFGVYANWRYRLDADNQLALGAEVRQRRYPPGRLRDRTRNIAEVTVGWTRSVLDGKGSLQIVANGGREFNTERSDGDSNFFGLTPTFSYDFNQRLGMFVFGLWQNDRYNIERLNIGAADQVLGIATRNDNLYEAGAGLTWRFAPQWSLNPEVLYVHDRSNIIAVNYSSTEVWITLRRNF
jgi:tetratricopeptide (TPR) repeat protein